MIYNISNGFVSFYLVNYTQINIGDIKKYLDPYIKIESINSLVNNELIVYLKDNKYCNKKLLLDNHYIELINNELTLYLEKTNENEIIFLKRVISDLINRLFEQNKGIFLHSSSIVDSNNSIIFIGDKGSGKTTTLLNILDKNNVGYSSNERTGIIKVKDQILTYGNTSRINIRANTLKVNESLRRKLSDSIDMSKYLKYSNQVLPMNCSERLVVSFDDITKKLNIPIISSGKLYSICNLIYNPNIDFEMTKVDYINIKKHILSSVLDGVFEQRSLLNNLFPVETVDYDELFEDNRINYYNIYQKNKVDNTDKIMKILRMEYKK